MSKKFRVQKEGDKFKIVVTQDGQSRVSHRGRSALFSASGFKKWVLEWNRTAVISFALWLAFMGATAGSALFPEGARLAAPFVCPQGYRSASAVTQTSHLNGKSTRRWTLNCELPDQVPAPASALPIAAALFGIYFAAGLGLVAILRLALRTVTRIYLPRSEP